MSDEQMESARILQPIRPLAICVFWHRGRILVNEAYDPVTRQRFCRPLGGGIEFSESSAQAIVREIGEELNAEVTNLRLIGTLENIFIYRGVPGHEIVQVYDGEFTNPSFYELASIPGAESDGQPFQAVWRELGAFSPELPLFPDGLLQLLQSSDDLPAGNRREQLPRGLELGKYAANSREEEKTAAAMPLSGGCFCRRVRYRIDSPLGPGRSCHCSRCRKAFSGAGSAYSEVAPGSFSWASGEENLTFHETAAGWGLCFCRTCGTTLCGTHQGHVHGVTLGSVDGDPGVQIEMHIFTGSRAPWDHIGGDAPQFPEFPAHR